MSRDSSSDSRNGEGQLGAAKTPGVFVRQHRGGEETTLLALEHFRTVLRKSTNYLGFVTKSEQVLGKDDVTCHF